MRRLALAWVLAAGCGATTRRPLPATAPSSASSSKAPIAATRPSCDGDVAAARAAGARGDLDEELADAERVQHVCQDPAPLAQAYGDLWLDDKARALGVAFTPDAHPPFDRRPSAADVARADALELAGVQALQGSDPTHGVDLFAQAFAVAPTPVTLARLGNARSRAGDPVGARRDFARAFALATAGGEAIAPRVSTGYTGEIRALAFSPDGATLASGGRDGVVRLWTVAGYVREKQPLFGHQREVTSLAYLPDGKLVSGDLGGTAIEWAPTGVAAGGSTGSSGIEALAADASGYASARVDGRVTVGPTTIAGGKAVHAVALSPDGKTIATGGADKTLRLWNRADGKALKSIDHPDALTSIAYAPDGKTIATGCKDGVIRLFDPSGAPVGELAGPRGAVNSIAFSPDGRTLISGGDDLLLHIWSVAQRTQTAAIRGERDEPIRAVAFSPDGKTIATGGDSIVLYDLILNLAIDQAGGDAHILRSVTFSPDGSRLAVSNGDGTVGLWSLDGSGKFVALTGGKQPVAMTAFSPDGKTIATAGWDGDVMLFDAATGAQTATVKEHTRAAFDVAFSPDGARLASGGADGVLAIWDLAAKKKHPIAAAGKRVNALVWLDAHTVATGGDDPIVHVWDADTGKPTRTFAGHTGAIFALALSPDGKRLASGSADDTIRVWDLASGQATVLAGHTDAVRRVTFVPWANVLYSASADRTVRAWDLATGKEIASGLALHEAPVAWLDCRPGGARTIALAEADGLVDVDDLDDPSRTPTLFSAGADWIVLAPDGTYDASEGGRKDLLWRAGPYVLPWYAGAERFARAGLLSILTNGPATATATVR